jgi:ketosteroid isomerase-like protein
MAAGRPSKVPRLPAVVRPIARLLFKRVLRKAAFPKGFKANKALNPASGPATPAEGRIRLETAHQEFNEACRRIAADGRPMTTGFGSVPALEYVRFQELHTRHHCKQMTTRQQAPSSMSQTSLVAIFVFVAGLGGGYFARSAAATLQRRTQAADVAAIEILNQEDIEATLARDQKRLIELWAENAVAFYPGSPPAVGKEAIGAHNQEFHAQYPGLKVLSYTSKIKNLQVEGGVACEWYEKDAEYRFGFLQSRRRLVGTLRD